jgi:NodT family efflux transporter outer membrane factor (OMF) lipoprotein
MRTGRARRFAPIVALSVVAIAGCSFAPKEVVPELPTATVYKEESQWQRARPADELPHGQWWTQFREPQLDELEKRLVDNSPDLAAALARYEQAKSYSDQLRAGLFPSVSVGASGERDRRSRDRPLTLSTAPMNYNSFTVDTEVNYELDLWGRIRNQVANGNYLAQASAADLESARLSLQVQLADDYLVLRGLDRLNQLLADTVIAYERALQLTQTRHDGGIASGLDTDRALAQLEAARSLSQQTLAQRATAEHAIAALVGASASQFSLAPQTTAMEHPDIPVGVPATLTQRRPDIAAAERRVAAAAANVGVARAAFFPDITLSGLIGYQSTSSGTWITAPDRFWSIGPSLMLPVFDAGRRRAQLAGARAALAEASQNYRSIVLSAFQQVEDNLTLLDHYRLALEDEHSAVSAATRSLDLTLTRYREGAVSYLDVVSSQTIALQTQRDDLNLEISRLRASVQLIRALGGGWNREPTSVAGQSVSAEISGHGG